MQLKASHRAVRPLIANPVYERGSDSLWKWFILIIQSLCTRGSDREYQLSQPTMLLSVQWASLVVFEEPHPLYTINDYSSWSSGGLLLGAGRMLLSLHTFNPCAAYWLRMRGSVPLDETSGGRDQSVKIWNQTNCPETITTSKLRDASEQMVWRWIVKPSSPYNQKFW